MNNHTKGILALIGLSASSVLMGVAVRFLSTEFTLFQQIYLRLFIASIFGYLIFRRKIDLRKLKSLPRKEWLVLSGRAAVGFLIAAPLWVQGFTLAKLANAAFIDAMPVSALMGFFILREKITGKKLLMIVLAFIGVVIISVSDFSNIFVWGKGEFLVFLSTFFWGIRNISRRWHTKILNDQEITTVIHFFGFLFLFLASLSIGEKLPLFGWHPSVFFILLIAGLINVSILFFTNYGFAALEANIAGTMLSLGTVFGIIFGFLFYREIPTLKELIGGVLISISVIEINRNRRKLIN